MLYTGKAVPPGLLYCYSSCLKHFKPVASLHKGTSVVTPLAGPVKLKCVAVLMLPSRMGLQQPAAGMRGRQLAGCAPPEQVVQGLRCAGTPQQRGH